MTRSKHHPNLVMQAQLVCTSSDFVIYNQFGEACDRLENLDPLTLSTTLTFSDTASDELVKLLMPAQMALKATFYAKQRHPGHDVVLGSVVLNTVAGRVSYDLELEIPDPVALGLLADTTYYIGATLRLGTAPYGLSSFLRGDLDETQLTIGTPIVEDQPIQEQPIDEPALEEEKPMEESVMGEDSDTVAEFPDSENAPETASPYANDEDRTSSADTQKSRSSRRKRTKKTA